MYSLTPNFSERGFKAAGPIDEVTKKALIGFDQPIRSCQFGPDYGLLGYWRRIAFDHKTNGTVVLLQKRYQRCFEAVERLYGGSVPTETLKRLNEIHKHTESIWADFVSMIPHGLVKYLLLAEAPPWSRTGRPKYVLDPEAEARSLMRALCRAFFDRSPEEMTSPDDTLRLLADCGFLIVDTLPFSIDYTNRGRQLKAYRALVSASCSTYLREKLDNPALIWSKQLRIAFGFRVNARSVISALEGRITLGDRAHTISEDLIVAGRAYLPDGELLRAVYRLRQ